MRLDFSPGALAIPILSAKVPDTINIEGAATFSPQLLLALLKMGMVSEEDLRWGKQNEWAIVQSALGRWWANHTAGFELFDWNLSVQVFEYVYGAQGCTDPWFSLYVRGDTPQLTLARHVEELEAQCAGFGQTVLAVLFTALGYLPESITPVRVLAMAEWYYWHGMSNEEEYIKDAVDSGEYSSREQMLKEQDIFTTEEFYMHMPRWLPRVKQVCDRQTIELAASGKLANDVIEVCDRINALVRSRSFKLKPFHMGASEIGQESVSACVILQWKQEDISGRVIDDLFNDIYQGGDCTEGIMHAQVKPEPAELKKLLREMEQMLQLADLVEKLILLLGEPVGTPLTEVFA